MKRSKFQLPQIKLKDVFASLACGAITVASTIGYGNYFAESIKIRNYENIEEAAECEIYNPDQQQPDFDLIGAGIGFTIGLTTFIGYNAYQGLKKGNTENI